MANSRYQKRHYEDTARLYAQAWARAEHLSGPDRAIAQITLLDALERFILMFKTDSAVFDEQLFRQACGPWAL